MAYIILILGGARSGKSRYAEELAVRSAQPIYLATAEPCDAEMQARIDAHRQRRDARWHTIEEPIRLAGALIDATAAATEGTADETCVMVDCITVWLGNLMHYNHDPDAAEDALITALADVPGTVIVVANEVGSGLVPELPSARRFRDRAGLLNQKIAAIADRVILVTAGLPLAIKGDLAT